MCTDIQGLFLILNGYQIFVHIWDVADPETSAKGGTLCDIRLRGNSIGFSVSHVYFFVGGAKVYSQTGWDHAGAET